MQQGKQVQWHTDLCCGSCVPRGLPGTPDSCLCPWASSPASPQANGSQTVAAVIVLQILFLCLDHLLWGSQLSWACGCWCAQERRPPANSQQRMEGSSQQPHKMTVKIDPQLHSRLMWLQRWTMKLWDKLCCLRHWVLEGFIIWQITINILIEMCLSRLRLPYYTTLPLTVPGDVKSKIKVLAHWVPGSSWLADGRFLTMSSHNRERMGQALCVSSGMGTSPAMRSPTLITSFHLITSQRIHLKTPLQWALGIQHMYFLRWAAQFLRGTVRKPSTFWWIQKQ